MVHKVIGGRIYDGSGEEPFQGTITIENGKIARITRGKEAAQPGDLDATGLIVTPGFVDIHRHHDMAVLYDPAFGELELAQGITTAVSGNCGLAPVPSSPEHQAEQLAYIEPCLGKMPENVKMYRFSEYMQRLSKSALALNTASLIGAGAVEAAVMGYESRGFTPAEREKAIELIQDGMRSGALGLSFGIMYHPECFLPKEDLVAMARACGQEGGMVSCHIRGEGNSLVASVREIIEICQEAQVPLNISHFKVTGVDNWGKTIAGAIAVIENARAAGQVVTVDVYPYTGGATTAMSLVPPCVTEGRPLSYLGTSEGAAALRREIYREQPGWDNMVKSIGWERTIIGSVTLEKNRIYCGKSVAQIAAELGLSDPCAWLGELIAEEEGKVGCIIMSMSQDDVDTVMRLPYAAVISDSLYGGGDSPHPRLYGSFPKILREYVKERGVLTLPEAIRKMTSMPAERVRLTDRGYLKEGYAADINIFDPEQICDKATFTHPKQLAQGIAYTLIGGEVAARDSALQAGRYGRLLTRKS